MGTLRALVRMSRPGNALMAAAGVATGASLAFGPDAEWLSVALAAVSAVAGLAAGNILNDLHDVEIDRRAHPDRPLVRGEIAFETAARGCGLLFLVALAFAFAANVLVGMFAGVLVVWLISYEVALKDRGFIGNIWISLVVAATFAIGAVAAALPPLTFDPLRLEAALSNPRLVVPLVLSVLAFLANVAREVFKDVEDAPADAGVRKTLPLHMGWRRAMNVGRFALAAAILYAVLGIVGHADLGPEIYLDAALLAPSIVLFVVAMVQREGRPAQRWTKIGMVLALAGLFAMGFF